MNKRIFCLLVTMMLSIACFASFSLAEEAGGEKTSAVKVRKKSKKVKGSVAKSTRKGKKLQKKGKKTSPPVAEPSPKQPAAPALVKEMRYWSNPSYTRISVGLEREAKFEYHHIPKNSEKGLPPRLFIDISGAKVGPGVKDISIGDGLLKQARIAQYKGDVVRVVLDMEHVKDFKVFPLSDPDRIIVDVKGDRPTEIARLEPTIQASPPVVEEPEKTLSTEEKAPLVQKSHYGKIRRIVVDPGHGGHDPGASGLKGTREKDVVLQIGLKLSRKLKEELGLDVVMTRSTDVFIPLDERTGIANKVNADLFVSIHANASNNRSAAGLETYYLNLAKSEKAAQLAARENGTSLEKVSLLQAILFDLMANYKINDSAHLAEEVQKAAYKRVSKGYAGLKNLGVKQGPFYVLVGATMPSILVETSFISNEREEERLKDPAYQDMMATGVLEGIRAYISKQK